MPILLSVQNLTKEFSGERLFEPLSFVLRDHDKTAVLGPNGTGKSTLIKRILGQVEKTSGNIVFSKNITLGYLSQDVIDNPEHTLYQECEDVFRALKEEEEKRNRLTKKRTEDPNNRKLVDEYAKLQSDFEAKEGYSYHYKIDRILNRFSFRKEDYDRKISAFSGGEKTRVAFAKLLLVNPDILVLDEPTNHLDIISIEWLEDYLKSYQGAVLFVSHDIAFVRHLADHILDIDNKVFTRYNTTYDNFAIEKKNRYENLLAQYERQEEEKAKLERFITFYRPKPRFASRARDRVHKLDRLEKTSIIDPTHKERTLNRGLKGEIREGKKLIEFNDVSVGYDSPLISSITFTLCGKDHLAVMGANGIGKSTFGKVLRNERQPYSGNRRRYFHRTRGVLRQDIRSYSSEETLFEHFRNLYPKRSNQEIYSGLGRYAFTYEEANEKKLCNLSGGELRRIEILQLSRENYDLLLLDEPTNHLDRRSISELVDALNQYEGTLVIISHDRDFIDKTCNKVLYFYEKKGYYYEGSYEDFKEHDLNKIRQEEKEALEAKQKEKRERKHEELLKKKEENKSKTRATRLSPEKIREKIDKREAKKKELSDSCYLEENYTDSKKREAISKEREELDAQLKDLYAQLELAR